jgi:aspartate-semialdehyde dehydrogenase
VVLVGSESLLGREVRDIAATAAEPLRLTLVAAEEEHAGTLTRVGDEPAAVLGLSADSLAGARAVVLAGSSESSFQALALLDEQAGAPVIDLTFAAEDRPDARLRAPIVERQAEPEGSPEPDEAPVHVIAHPAAVALALFLRRLHAADPIRQSVIQLFAPASEHGAAGVQELQEQTVSLLSFKSLPQKVFDGQLSFNMLAKYGEEARRPIEDTEQRIERHLATLLNLPGEGEGAPMPSFRLIQAPVFHGYSACAWVEFEGNPGVEAIENGLATEGIEVRGIDVEPPTNVGQAGQGGIAVGAISPDRNNPEACWFWLVADNFRLSAEDAVAVARELP